MGDGDREATPGLDPAALTAWWRAHLGGGPDTALSPDLGGDLHATLIAGGKSNLTYRVGDGDRTWVVRRPPLGHVLATAHDMRREHTVMTALADTAVPVPRTHALCEDESVLGAPFYVMADVAGTPYRRAAQLEPLGPAMTRHISELLVDTLAALHEVDPGAVGLADFGRPEGFLGRQVRRWRGQMEQSRTRELPEADALMARLEAGVARAEAGALPAGIVHGDFRLDNLLVAGEHEGAESAYVAAVLDWEMATLGDPLTDLALMLLYGRLAEVVPGTVADASVTPGFLTEAESVERYAVTRGVDLHELGFHLGLAAYKLAAILEGIHYRHTQGQTVGSGFDGVGAAVVPLLQAGLDATDH